MNKYIFTVSLLFRANNGLFYVFYLLKLETVLIGVFRELTMIPSFLRGSFLPLLLVYNFFKKKDSRSIMSKKLFYQFSLSFKFFKQHKRSMKTKYIDLNILN